MHLANTQFWNHLMEDVYGPRSGGAKIVVDAEDARTGVGKTTAACCVARMLAETFGYQLTPDDGVLSGTEYLQRYREHPDNQPSVIVLDEFVGAGAGDSRRAMAEKNVNLGRAWQLQRTKQVVTVATLPDWNDVDKRLKKLADYRLWCREKPVGRMRAYEVGTPFDGRGIQTRRLGDEDIEFPRMDDDPFYRALSKKKDDLIHSEAYDADDLGEDKKSQSHRRADQWKEQRDTMVREMYEETDKTYEDIADEVGMTPQGVGEIVRAGGSDGEEVAASD